jgi:hypothetical protein
MRRLGALLVIALATVFFFSASATAGRSASATAGRSAGRSVVIDLRAPHRPMVRVRPPRPRPDTFVPAPFVLADPGAVVVPVPFAVPVPVVAVPPPPPDAAPPASPEEPQSRPVVVNPGPKIIDVAPPAPGARTTTVVVQRGSTTVVETVPLQ